MLKNLNDVITDVDILQKGYIERNGFIFASLSGPANIYDAIVIRNPIKADVVTPVLGVSSKNLQDHIDLINNLKLKKAIVIAESIEFIKNCPSLNCLQIIPALNMNQFDFSPLYDMPDIKELICQTEYGDMEQYSSSIDYRKIKGLLDLSVTGKGHHHYFDIKKLESLFLSGNTEYMDLEGINEENNLKEITVIACKLKNIKGIKKAVCLEKLSLWYNRALNDISELSSLADSLKILSIENCPKIKDFSCLYKLRKLEYLELCGKNKLPDLSFLKEMKNLKSFIFSMEILDGDLNLCLQLPYAYCERGKAYYNLKDRDLPKNLQRDLSKN